MFIQADAAKLPFADDSFDFVFGSPPYQNARTYGIGAQRDCLTWIDWMMGVTREAVRVSRGLVVWICAGVTRDWCYWPGPEGLLYEWWLRGGRCWRPAYWYRVGIPGSGGKQWLRNCVPPKLANPGNLIKIKVGGGQMGHKLAHENEAPFPQALAEWFIRSWCPPGGTVLDPFSGSGTTVAAAMALGRRGVGADIRLSQCDLGRRRCGEIQTEMF